MRTAGGRISDPSSSCGDPICDDDSPPQNHTSPERIDGVHKARTRARSDTWPAESEPIPCEIVCSSCTSGPFLYTGSTAVQENRGRGMREMSSPPAEQIFQGSHDAGIAHEKALFFAGGCLVYRLVLALKITDVLWESRRGLVSGESQCLRQHRADEITR
jgi:hypothetical protein